jgi:hypothetical protein
VIFEEEQERRQGEKGGLDEKMKGNRNGCRDRGSKGMSICKILNTQQTASQ